MNNKEITSEDIQKEVERIIMEDIFLSDNLEVIRKTQELFEVIENSKDKDVMKIAANINWVKNMTEQYVKNNEKK